ncbi:MAG: hypothetical protein IJ597_05120 [Synergistaceae bacterium]|nr:hypothetical protein [Synergistaceae bacterium]
MGIPEMKKFWIELEMKIKSGKANKNEQRVHKKLDKALKLIAKNPRHPGLHTHEISKLSDKFGEKVWESYLENNTPKAGRIFWVYGPGKNDITIIGLEQHPDDKSVAYSQIILSKKEDKIN